MLNFYSCFKRYLFRRSLLLSNKKNKIKNTKEQLFLDICKDLTKILAIFLRITPRFIKLKI